MENSICYYCERVEADSESRYVFTIYKKLDSNYGLGLTGIRKTTRYYELDIEVPRCKSCAQIHNTPVAPAGRLALLLFLVSGAIAYYFAQRWYVALIVAVVCGIAGLIVYFQLFYRKKLKQLGIKDKGELNAYEPLKVILKSGWQLLRP